MCNAYCPSLTGLAAYLNGETRAACPPQLDGDERDGWCDGWDFGDREIDLAERSNFWATRSTAESGITSCLTRTRE